MESFDSDHSGKLGWDEFYSFCRTCLKLKDKTSQLRLLFDTLDEDMNCCCASPPQKMGAVQARAETP
eukprot:3026461-Amphidinium_carterae.1